MKFKFTIIIFTIIAIFSITTIFNNVEAEANKYNIKTIVPAYFYPGQHWDELISIAKGSNIIAIGNPNNGAGKKIDKKYYDTFDKFVKNDGKLSGYVHTGYGKRSLTVVKKDIDMWFKLYPMTTGIFLDEQATSKEYINYYSELVKYIHNKKGIAIGNPGTVPLESYISMFDISCIHENSNANIQYKEWMNKYNKDKFYVIVHSINRKVSDDRVGWIYSTSDKMPNPFDTLGYVK